MNLTAPVVDDSGVTFETMSFQDQLSNNVNQSIFFSLSIPVFNNFGIHAGIERAKVGVLSAQLSKAQTAQSLTQTVQTAWADARAAERTFEANDKALEAASLAMDNAEAGLKPAPSRPLNTPTPGPGWTTHASTPFERNTTLCSRHASSISTWAVL